MCSDGKGKGPTQCVSNKPTTAGKALQPHCSSLWSSCGRDHVSHTLENITHREAHMLHMYVYACVWRGFVHPQQEQKNVILWCGPCKLQESSYSVYEVMAFEKIEKKTQQPCSVQFITLVMLTLTLVSVLTSCYCLFILLLSVLKLWMPGLFIDSVLMDAVNNIRWIWSHS